MEGGDILEPHWYLILKIQVSLVDDAVLLEGELHIEGFSFPLPGVAPCVCVDELVPIHNLIDGFLPGHLQLVLIVREGVDYSDPLGLPCEFPDVELLILPPRDHHFLLLETQMQELSLGKIVLLNSLRIYALARLLCLGVKPVSDIRASRRNYRLHECRGSVLLNQQGHIVDVLEETHPQVIRSVVLRQLRHIVVPSSPVGTRQEALQRCRSCIFVVHSSIQVVPNQQPSKTAQETVVLVKHSLHLLHEVSFGVAPKGIQLLLGDYLIEELAELSCIGTAFEISFDFLQRILEVFSIFLEVLAPQFQNGTFGETLGPLERGQSILEAKLYLVQHVVTLAHHIVCPRFEILRSDPFYPFELQRGFRLPQQILQRFPEVQRNPIHIPRMLFPHYRHYHSVVLLNLRHLLIDFSIRFAFYLSGIINETHPDVGLLTHKIFQQSQAKEVSFDQLWVCLQFVIGRPH